MVVQLTITVTLLAYEICGLRLVKFGQKQHCVIYFILCLMFYY